MKKFYKSSIKKISEKLKKITEEKAHFLSELFLYINFLSHDVYTNLQELKNCIAEIDSGLTGNH